MLLFQKKYKCYAITRNSGGSHCWISPQCVLRDGKLASPVCTRHNDFTPLCMSPWGSLLICGLGVPYLPF